MHIDIGLESYVSPLVCSQHVVLNTHRNFKECSKTLESVKISMKTSANILNLQGNHWIVRLITRSYNCSSCEFMLAFYSLLDVYTIMIVMDQTP